MIIALVFLVLFSVAVVLLNIYPYHPNSLIGWGLLSLLSLPIVLVGEFLGESVLGAAFVAKLPRVLRIFYAVLVIGGAVAALIFAVPILEPHLGKWGG